MTNLGDFLVGEAGAADQNHCLALVGGQLGERGAQLLKLKPAFLLRLRFQAFGIAAVGIFSFVYSWNDFFGPLIYLAGHEELQPISVALAHFNGIYYSNPAFIQAGTVMTFVIPVILFLIFQRAFTRGIVLTSVEK